MPLRGGVGDDKISSRSATVEDDNDAQESLAQKREKNRIAQRKYRKNLKCRIEELERRAAEPTQVHASQLGQFGAMNLNNYDRSLEQGYQDSLNSDFQLQLSAINGWQTTSEYSDGSLGEKDGVLPNLTSTILPDSTALPFSRTQNALSISNMPIAGYNEPKTSNMEGNTPVEKRRTSSLSKMFTQPRESTKDIKIEDRVKDVLDYIRQAGFESFDDIFTVYYTNEFEKGTYVQLAQRLSRNRSLPRVLRALRDNVGMWTKWEAIGYHDEIIRSAENILVAEFDKVLGQSISIDTEQIGGEKNATGHESGDVEEEVPNLWALIIALISADYEEDQRLRGRRLLEYVSSLADD